MVEFFETKLLPNFAPSHGGPVITSVTAPYAYTLYTAVPFVSLVLLLIQQLIFAFLC